MMWKVFLGAALTAAVVYAARFYALRRSLRDARRLMEEINGRLTTNQKLTFTAPDKELGGLLAEINGGLERARREQAFYTGREKEFRRQIANISHDLRTPLTSILGYLELLEDPDLSERERREFLNVVKRKAGALQELISAFYDLSRLESGEYALDRERTELYGLLCETLAAFYEDFQAAGLTVETQISREPVFVMADKKAAKRVFFNLMQNILNHGTGQVRIEQRREGAEIVTIFSNLVQGMRPEDVPRVFERFFTADEMRTGQNTGLGMTIVQKLLTEMGHRVDASLSQAADGDWFTVSIGWRAEEPNDSDGTNGSERRNGFE